jgi:surface antigen
MSDTPEKNVSADEILVMLFADLEADAMLTPDQHAALSAALARNPGLTELYQTFLFTRDPVARAFDAALAAPIPERLLRTVRESPSPRARPTAAKGWAGLAWLGDMLRAPTFSPAVAIPALAVSIAAGWLLHTTTSGGAGWDARGTIASAEAQRALELTPSGVKVDVARGVRLVPRFTFATEDKAWCRQYSLTYAENLEAGGIACRSGDGGWQVLLQTGLTASSPLPPPKGPLPAGGERESETLLDGVRSQLKQGDVLGREEEEERIAEGWRSK